jgi:hypothetical protein
LYLVPWLNYKNIIKSTNGRIEAYECESKFVDKETEVNEDKHIYLKDLKFLDKFENDNKYRDGFLYILCKYCKAWVKDENKYPITGKVNETKGIILDLNDIVQNFIDNNLEITSNE